MSKNLVMNNEFSDCNMVMTPINKNIKSGNYQIDTYKKNIYIYGIARNTDELEIVVDEANSILDVNKVIASILLVEDLRIQKD